METIKQEAESVVFDKTEEGTPMFNITLDRYQLRDLVETFDKHTWKKDQETIELHFFMR